MLLYISVHMFSTTTMFSHFSMHDMCVIYTSYCTLVSYPDRFRPRVTQWRKMAGGRVGSGLRD